MYVCVCGVVCCVVVGGVGVSWLLPSFLFFLWIKKETKKSREKEKNIVLVKKCVL